MRPINQHREQTAKRIIHDNPKILDCLLIIHFQMEPLQDLTNRLIRLEPNIRNFTIHHERKQIENQICALPQRGVGGEAVLAELGVIGVRGATHAVDHFSREFHEWGEWFWVAAEDEAKVSVEEVSVGGEEEVVEVAVADAEEVGHDAVAGAGADVCVHYFGLDAKLGGFVGGCGFKVAKDAVVELGRDVAEAHGGNELHYAGEGGGGEDPVGHEFEVEVFFLEKLVHENKHLDDELVLT